MDPASRLSMTGTAPANSGDASPRGPTNSDDGSNELLTAVYEVLNAKEVTTDGLRTVFEAVLSHVERTYGALGEDALDGLFERCRIDFARVSEGRLAELSDSIERLRAVLYRMESRIEALERDSRRTQDAEPTVPRLSQDPPHDTRASLPHVTLSPRHFVLPESHDHGASPRVNPAIFEMKPHPSPEVENVATLWHFGQLEYGLDPVATLLPDFRKVVDYRSYRLDNTSTVDNQSVVSRGSATKTVTRMRSMMPRLRNFDGREPITLIRFLRDIRQAMNSVGLSEGAAVRTISWFLEGDALQTYSARAFTGVRQTYETAVTWSRIVNVLIERYITDDILGDAYSQVTTAVQADDETEGDFLSRIERYADSCCGVFDDYLVVNYFLRGLLPTTRPLVSQKVHDLEPTRRANLNVVRRIAQAEGDAYRARLQVGTKRRDTTSSGRRTKQAAGQPTLAIRYDDDDEYESLCDPSVNLVPPILAVADDGSTPSEATSADETVDATLQERIDSVLPSRIPDLTQRQISMASSIIPKDSEAYVCWMCRTGGHTLYTCPFLTKEQRLYAAYQNYRYQLETRPGARNMLKQRAQEFIDRDSGGPRYGQRRNTTFAPQTILRRRDDRRPPPYGRRNDNVRPRNAAPNREVLDAIMTIRNHAGDQAEDLVRTLSWAPRNVDSGREATNAGPIREARTVEDTEGSTDTSDDSKN